MWNQDVQDREELRRALLASGLLDIREVWYLSKITNLSKWGLRARVIPVMKAATPSGFLVRSSSAG